MGAVKPSIWTVEFWKGTAERAIATAGQVFIALVVPLAVSGGSLFEVPWMQVIGVCGLAALLAVVKAVVANLASNGSGPSALPKVESLNVAPPGKHMK